MAKLTRVPAKVFAASAAADEIGQFGSAVAGAKLETADVATIQALSAWLDGWSEALVSGNRYPALQEMNGLLKVLSYQGAYALQEGIPEYDSDTTYYIGSIVKKTGTFELYGSLTNDNVGNALTDTTNWKLLIDLNIAGYTSDTANMPTIANNVSDANNDIDFSVGFCYDLATNEKITSTAKTKRLDASFAEGTNQGGLDTGSKAINTWYYCFSISKDDGTSDFLFSTSTTSPTMPSGFVNKRRIGSILTDGSGNILAFKQYNNEFFFVQPINDINISPVPIVKTDYVTSVPPSMIGIFNLYGYSTNSVGQVIHYCGMTITAANFFGASQYISASSNPAVSVDRNILVDNLSKISYFASATTGGLSLSTQGFIDKRGVN